MTASTRKSCKDLRPKDFIRIVYVITTATVVNQKNRDGLQGIDAHRFTFPISVTSVRCIIALLEGDGLWRGTS